MITRSVFVCNRAACGVLVPTLVVVAVLFGGAGSATAELSLQTTSPSPAQPTATTFASPLGPASQPVATPVTAGQQKQLPWWFPIVNSLLTLLTIGVTASGWWVTHDQQRQLARSQERMLRQRELATSNARKLQALGDYLEFPNCISSERDLLKIMSMYDEQWEKPFGKYRAFAFRYDSLAFGGTPENITSDGLGTLLNELDSHIDMWIESLRGGTDLKTASLSHLIPAMTVAEAAIRRLSLVEHRLLLENTSVPDQPEK